MDTGKVVRIHEDVPEPKREEEKSIPVPDWPVKKPVEVPAEVEG